VASETSCTRCGGFIIPEGFRDSGSYSVGWHCLLCGEIVDHVILQNRARLLVPSPSPIDDDSTEWQYSEDEYELGAMTEAVESI